MEMRTGQKREKKDKPKPKKQPQTQYDHIVMPCIHHNSSQTPSESNLTHHLSLLHHPKRSVRLDSHSSLSSSLSSSPSYGFVSGNYVTLLFHCLHSINNGTQKRPKVSKFEICLSLRLVSLLAINLDAGGDHAHQVFDESIPSLSRALLHFESSLSDSDIVVGILDCLGFLGFFGSTHPEEIQSVMLIIWDSLTKNGSKWSDLIRFKAISAWSFLLSSMPGSHVSNKYWKSVTSYFLSLMCDDGVALAVDDALGLIFEMGFLNKFEEPAEEGCSRDKLKDKITDKLRGLAIEDRGKKLKVLADEDGNGDGDEDGQIPRTIKIAQQVKDGLILSKVCEIIQSKFIRGFLGPHGFANYLQITAICKTFSNLLEGEAKRMIKAVRRCC
uniref:Interferon-related developmental regulator N-terminal domain-containing protein n=1 Tax=Opuntia streptacantha TaxID=393608 RepID=A0A7C9E9H5_OPUST